MIDVSSALICWLRDCEEMIEVRGVVEKNLSENESLRYTTSKRKMNEVEPEATIHNEQDDM